MTLRWKKDELADPANDLCLLYRGTYHDIVQDFNNKWSCVLDNESRLISGLDSRQDAICWFDQYYQHKD
jgi:hypothetical protein